MSRTFHLFLALSRDKGWGSKSIRTQVNATRCWGAAKDSSKLRDFALELSRERCVIEPAMLGCDGYRFRVREPGEIFEFRAPQCRQGHNWNSAASKRSERHGGEFAAVRELSNYPVATLDSVEGKHCSDPARLFKQL